MSGGPRFLAVDLGAESGRAVEGVVDADGIALREVHRFANVPVALPDRLAWDVEALLAAVRWGIEASRDAVSVGIDGWAVDVALLRADGTLTAPPRCYRDRLTAGILPHLFERVPRAQLYARTGIQMMEINTLCQLLAMQRDGTPDLDGAAQMLLIPDYLQHRLGADRVSERTNAGTTQMLSSDGSWALDVLQACGLPAALCAPVVEPGAVVGRVRGREDVRVVAVASHDTASAVVGTPLPLGVPAMFISSGTWSLVGMELEAPVLDDTALRLNLSNEHGVGGTVRLLRNVMGLWLVQQCRAAFSREDGGFTDYATLMHDAEQAPPLVTVFDPDDPDFLRPGDAPRAIAAACARTGEPPPRTRGALLRAVVESLALRYRWCLDALALATGTRPRVIHVVGGGSRNALLCRCTADATRLAVVAGPVEASATGNVAVQAIAHGVLGSVAEARALVATRASLEHHEPDARTAARWDEAYARFCALPGAGAPAAAAAMAAR
jgi:rhamnulokinase